MGIITSIITSIVILVIALIIVEFIFNPYYFNSLKTSLTNTLSGLANNVQTTAIKTAAASQSNKPILYIAENGNNTVALFDTQYNKIIGYIALDNQPNNIALNNGELYVAENYYNYHTPQYHGAIAIINTSNDKIIDTIYLNSTPYGISVSPNGIYVIINSNNELTEINLKNGDNSIIFNVNGTYSPATNLTGFAPSISIEDSIFSPNGEELFTSVNYEVTAPNYGSPIYQTNRWQEIFITNSSDNKPIRNITITESNNDYGLYIQISSPQSLVVSSDGSKLYDLSEDTEGIYLYIINATNGNIIKTLTLLGASANTGGGLSLSPDDAYLYVTTGEENSFSSTYVINTSTETIVDTINTKSEFGYDGSLMSYATDVAVGSNFTYVWGGPSYALAIINRANDKITNITAISGCPCEAILSPN